ncbi:Hsp70 family protein [Dactylosporangium sp. NBC_01737]|uniref:Hsp70 family protein n=1 Tax=Dactylosporangium sp. NBC_01737 TaxID=2975959 RepID=UPI002E14B78D|nr:Hsp70 family protein [Dactylosporangium sp. NBC_01737]
MVALGVDFGTSHTVAVARWPDGRARPLLFDGSPLLPSATFWEDGELVVGRDAVHSARRAPASFEPNPKRRIDDGHVLLGEREVPVHDLLVAVFQRVRAEFTRTAGGPPATVTVTHPANWASTRRKALAAAVRGADLPDATLVPEPVAAATYFVRVLRHLVPVGSAVVVYDLGAGTFDGSVVARTPEGFEVLAVDGRDDLGGLDFDEVVLAMIGRTLPPERWQRLITPSTIEEARAARMLRDEVREAKERLSRASSVTVLIPLLDVDVQLTREEFDAAARPLVERSVRVLTETVRLSRVTTEQVAGIFLVGGASQIPLVATELHRAFGRPPVTIEQPEMVVAEGSVLVGARVDKPSGAVVPASRQPPGGVRGSARPGASPAGGRGAVPPGGRAVVTGGAVVPVSAEPVSGAWHRCVPTPCPVSRRHLGRRSRCRGRRSRRPGRRRRSGRQRRSVPRRLGHRPRRRGRRPCRRCRPPPGRPGWHRSPGRGRRCHREPCRSALCRSARRRPYTGCRRRNGRIRPHARSTTSRRRPRWSTCRNTCRSCRRRSAGSRRGRSAGPRAS